VCFGYDELGAVQNIVELTAEFQLHAFAHGNREEAVHGVVDVVGARAIENVAARVAEMKLGRRHEAALVIPSLDGWSVEPAVADAIGPGCIAYVGIVLRQLEREWHSVLRCPDDACLPSAQDPGSRSCRSEPVALAERQIVV